MNKSKEYLKKKLSKEEYNVLIEKGTEVPFSGEYLDNKEKGMYTCKICGNELFSSDTKFDSGTGWPSFSDFTKSSSVKLKDDSAHGMNRVEVICGKCGSHLGHVFDDNSTHGDSGKRYCINSVCLNFRRKNGKFKN
ncbi:MAG TPA: peptide-methionine (R)-S-oxide reductase MsrB [Candidatus Nanoarchaeia archaeon]|nr:peptide-methionine (R)-S-oxide reductase MsrB [Candidatus Nanoarchaeia archaeon]